MPVPIRKVLKAGLIARAGSQQGAAAEIREVYPQRKITPTVISLLIRGWLIPTPELVTILEDYTGKNKAELFPDLFSQKETEQVECNRSQQPCPK
ncbi:MAG: hypothetical protein JRG73_07265 [Deltaproteobacteria bacterium]|nr:hypothetical protein [Deltaproteobacteria bacterium]